MLPEAGGALVQTVFAPMLGGSCPWLLAARLSFGFLEFARAEDHTVPEQTDMPEDDRCPSLGTLLASCWGSGWLLLLRLLARDRGREDGALEALVHTEASSVTGWAASATGS